MTIIHHWCCSQCLQPPKLLPRALLLPKGSQQTNREVTVMGLAALRHSMGSGRVKAPFSLETCPSWARGPSRGWASRWGHACIAHSTKHNTHSQQQACNPCFRHSGGLMPTRFRVEISTTAQKHHSVLLLCDRHHTWWAAIGRGERRTHLRYGWVQTQQQGTHKRRVTNRIGVPHSLQVALNTTDAEKQRGTANNAWGLGQTECTGLHANKAVYTL